MIHCTKWIKLFGVNAPINVNHIIVNMKVVVRKIL
ncbi:unnamed protein product [Brugia pahangi]|uniref:Uncharacterized protein n=1 Tax=Brugia pahangi TaxID=6280 RepID=A0A0N4TG42_BRUPA|nr:unnamed protein product [Brugia pahangi]